MNGNTSEYFYDAMGVKRSAYYLTSMDPLEIPLGDVSQEFVDMGENVSEYHQTDYCGNFIYEGGFLSKVLTPEGYLAPTTYYYKPTPTSTPTYKTEMMHNYFLRDHLGNTRVQLMQKKTTTGAIYFSVSDTKDYYAFGLEHGKPWEQLYGGSTTSTNPYLYNGKEMDRMHGFNQLDYGARWYDPSLGRWGGVMDPLAEKYPNMSSYVYCVNNPVSRIDPDGRFPILTHYAMLGEAISQNGIFKSMWMNVSGVTDLMLNGTSVIADMMDWNKSSVHMDNLNSFTAVKTAYQTASNQFEKSMENGNYENAGEALHTVADFYSHSNYIQLYQNYIGKGKLDENNVPTFQDVLSDKKYAGFLTELKRSLKTGTYEEKEGMLKSYSFDKNNPNKNCHGQMNVDSKSSPKGSEPFNANATKYDAALKTAQKDLNQKLGGQ